ncbi:MAG: hypothetical protein ACD_46C00188G0002 [uncultured bacterium]|nr:MAG: hypothetical protein ACD_46C00188G0002 [uncultured bacterium]
MRKTFIEKRDDVRFTKPNLRHYEALIERISNAARVVQKKSFEIFLSFDVDDTIISNDLINFELIDLMKKIVEFVDKLNSGRASNAQIKIKLGLTTARIPDNLELERRAKIKETILHGPRIHEIKDMFLSVLNKEISNRKFEIKNKYICACGHLDRQANKAEYGISKSIWFSRLLGDDRKKVICHVDDSIDELRDIDFLRRKDISTKNEVSPLTFIHMSAPTKLLTKILSCNSSRFFLQPISERDKLIDSPKSEDSLSSVESLKEFSLNDKPSSSKNSAENPLNDHQHFQCPSLHRVK